MGRTSQKTPLCGYDKRLELDLNSVVRYHYGVIAEFNFELGIFLLESFLLAAIAPGMVMWQVFQNPYLFASLDFTHLPLLAFISHTVDRPRRYLHLQPYRRSL